MFYFKSFTPRIKVVVSFIGSWTYPRRYRCHGLQLPMQHSISCVCTLYIGTWRQTFELSFMILLMQNIDVEHLLPPRITIVWQSMICIDMLWGRLMIYSILFIAGLGYFLSLEEKSLVFSKFGFLSTIHLLDIICNQLGVFGVVELTWIVYSQSAQYNLHLVFLTVHYFNCI